MNAFIISQIIFSCILKSLHLDTHLLRDSSGSFGSPKLSVVSLYTKCHGGGCRHLTSHIFTLFYILASKIDTPPK